MSYICLYSQIIKKAIRRGPHRVAIHRPGMLMVISQLIHISIHAHIHKHTYTHHQPFIYIPALCHFKDPNSKER